MLLSMTGFGRASNAYQDKEISIEVRSLNSKFMDVRMKVPQNYRVKEPDFRKILQEKIERGKIEFTMEVKSPDGEEEYSLNRPLLERYYKELSKIADDLQLNKSDLIPSILRMPNVVSPASGTIDEQEWQTVSETVHQAIKKFTSFRRTEGQAMETDLQLRINNIQSFLVQIAPYEAERVVKLKAKLLKNLEDNFGKERVDQNRFEQEVIYYLEKIDITEEKVRLGQHCKYFLEQLTEDSVLKGRKLSFIAQEIGREINTLGAKAYSSDIQKIVVKMKDDLEKIKEQVANSV